MALDSLSFSGIDSLVTNKHKSLEQLRAEKAQKLQDKLDTLGVTGTVLEQYDADTYNIQLPDGTTQIVRAGGGIDTPDSYFGASIAAQKKKDNQKNAYNQITGIPFDQIKDSDLTAWKNQVDSATANSGFGVNSDITYIPSGTKSKLEGDTRLIAEIYNKDNQNLADIFDTPLSNAAYSAPWNKEKRASEANQAQLLVNALKIAGDTYKSGWNEDGSARTVQQTDGFFTRGDTDGLTASQIGYGTRYDKANQNNWADSADSLLNSVAGAYAMLNDELLTAPVYAMLALTDGKGSSGLSTTLKGGISDYNVTKFRYGDTENMLTPEDISMYMDITRKGQLNEKGEFNPTPAQLAFFQSGKMKILGNIERDIQENKKVYSSVVEAAQDIRNEVHNANLDTHIKNNYDRIYEKEGLLAANIWMMTNHPTHPVEKIAESLPIMVAALSGVGMIDIYSSRYMKAIAEREKLIGRELTSAELNIAKVSIGIAVVAERAGAEVIFKKVPGMDKLVTTLLTKFPKLSKALIPLSKLSAVGIVEGGSEVITELGEQYAVQQDFSKIKDSDLAYAGSIGAFGGASIKAPQTALETFQSNNALLKKQQEKLAVKLNTPDFIDSEGVATTQDAEGAVPNPKALKPAHRTKLQKRLDEIEISLIESNKKQAEKEIKADVKKANKKIKAINKQIVKMQKSEQTEAVVAQIAVRQKQIADLEKSIKIKTGVIQPNADKDAAVTLEDTVAQAKELSNTDINSVDDLDLTELATKVEDIRELLGKSDTQEAIDILGSLDKIQSDVRNRMLSILGDSASDLETSKDTILYSLNSIGEDSKEQNKVIKTLLGKSDEEVSPEEKAVLKQRQETLKIANELKTLQDVNKEITVGSGKEKKSFDEHLAQANTEQGMNGLEYFARKMSDKAKVFLGAQQTALETGKTQYINKKNLTTTDKAPVDSKTHWAIFPTSNNPLVDILQKEAEYGQRALNLAKSTVELESNKTESTTSKRNQSIKDILQRSENVKTPKGDVNTLIKKKEAKKEQVNKVISDLIGKTEETKQPDKAEQAKPVKVAVALDPKTVKDVKAKAKQAVGNKTVADRNLMGDGFNLANTIEENLGKEYADIFRSEVLRLTESNARKWVQSKEKEQQNLFKKEEAEKASTETTSPEVTEPTDDSSVDILDTPLVTKAGFRKRFASHGLIKNGRIIPFSEFTELDSDIIIAAAKSLKVCK